MYRSLSSVLISSDTPASWWICNVDNLLTHIQGILSTDVYPSPSIFPKDNNADTMKTSSPSSPHLTDDSIFCETSSMDPNTDQQPYQTNWRKSTSVESKKALLE